MKVEINRYTVVDPHRGDWGRVSNIKLPWWKFDPNNRINIDAWENPVMSPIDGITRISYDPVAGKGLCGKAR